MFEIQLAVGAKVISGTLVTAFPSVGMVGSIAGSFVAESLKMERTAYVLSDDVPPAALVQDGIPSYPLRILGHKDMFIMTSEFQIPLTLSTSLAKTLLEWAAKNGFKQIVCLEGLMVNQEGAEADKEIRVFGVGSTSAARDTLTKAGIEQFKVGMITGVSGALLSEAERTGRDAVCLLVEANAMYPDARGAAKLVESLTKLVPSLQLDLKELYKEAEMIEENVKATVERTKEMLSARQGQAERLGKSYMYG
ncbi:MAG: hypothetical protein A3K76_02805 [Euryarchaeota archaeon RBG_13_57_23]|nr:MAG: hypothetical protein A3K76_02805 [Euryarchaeota archaeon RBG_13_57_23]